LQLVYILLVVMVTAWQLDLGLIQPVLYLMVALTIVSGFHYLYRCFTHVSAGEV